jgi:transketolase C-terminal domain/subunit
LPGLPQGIVYGIFINRIPLRPSGERINGVKDVLIISTGLMTMRALEAAKELQADGVDFAVLHVPTIKPLE